MTIFGKQVEEPKEESAPKHPVEKEEPKEEERPTSAPLFVKIDRYRNILTGVNELKTTLVAVKSAFSVLTEMDKLRAETLEMIEKSIGKIDKRLHALDSEFLRPSGFHEEMPHDVYNIESLEVVLSSLKSQVDQLKTEIDKEA